MEMIDYFISCRVGRLNMLYGVIWWLRIEMRFGFSCSIGSYYFIIVQSFGWMK